MGAERTAFLEIETDGRRVRYAREQLVAAAGG
jgi:hypothetical protein